MHLTDVPGLSHPGAHASWKLVRPSPALQRLCFWLVAIGSLLPISCESYFGDLHRRIKWRFGARDAIAATAHKRAVLSYIICSPLANPTASPCSVKSTKRQPICESRLCKQAADLSFQLTAVPELDG